MASEQRQRAFRGLVQVTRALVVSQHTRRVVMFYTVLGALFMLFFGDVFLAGWLREHPIRFAVYWLICAWLTVLAALLAIYDLLMLRLQHRRTRRQLQKEILPENFKDSR